MKLTIGIQLKPSKDQKRSLLQTLENANQIANIISADAWENKTFGQFSLHKLIYKSIKDTFDVSAQMIVRLIAKVADAYKLNKMNRRIFRPHGAIAYDDRILSWKEDSVSIWTIDGRKRIPFACGARQFEMLKFRQGESDLVYRKGKWYLFACVNIEEPLTFDPIEYLGIDIGINNLAVDSDGEIYSGAAVEKSRRRYQLQKGRLQQCAEHQKQSGKRPKNIRRKLKGLSGKEARFKTHTNHVISKSLVYKAEDTNRGIALENLKGIDPAKRFRKAQRDKGSKWAFAQLRNFIEYKARLHGVVVAVVDPAYTSQTCSSCGHCEKANRQSRDYFLCLNCGHFDHADVNAALNISMKAAISRPTVSERAAPAA